MVQYDYKEKELLIMKVEKVWGYNCYGVCIALIEESKIEEYNTNHPVISQKIASWMPA